jgi:hypothetical protein
MKFSKFFLSLLLAGSLSISAPIKASEDIVTDAFMVASMVFVVWLNFFGMHENLAMDSDSQN